MSLQAPLLLSIAKAGEKSCNVPNNLSSQPGMAHFPPVSDISATSHSLEVFFTPGIPKAAAVHVTPGRSWTVVLVQIFKDCFSMCIWSSLISLECLIHPVPFKAGSLWANVGQAFSTYLLW